MDSPSVEQPKCACGKLMELDERKWFICENCDTVQDQERLEPPRKRIMTASDMQFKLTWRQRFRVFYPEQELGGI